MKLFFYAKDYNGQIIEDCVIEEFHGECYLDFIAGMMKNPFLNGKSTREFLMILLKECPNLENMELPADDEEFAKLIINEMIKDGQGYVAD